MRRLVQKVVDINPSLSADKARLQEYMDKKSSEGWEMCGQVGLFYVFKRWEEVPTVVEGGGYQTYQTPSFGQPYSSYNTYRPQTPYFNPGGNNYGTSYNPNNFGVRVNEQSASKVFDDE